MFGQLIDLAILKLNLKVPYPIPGSSSNQAKASINNSTSLINDAGPLFGPFSAINTSLFIQHPGFYYLISAQCAYEQWSRFKKIKLVLENDPSLSLAPPISMRGSFSQDCILKIT